mmetsp:Transcript_1117/g.1302  ORF Transcript_1117/g.1302 Transcript_1117/m.1302 type:complete len:85 (+) Transcript_1117:187-441(+)
MWCTRLDHSRRITKPLGMRPRCTFRCESTCSMKSVGAHGLVIDRGVRDPIMVLVTVHCGLMGTPDVIEIELFPRYMYSAERGEG